MTASPERTMCARCILDAGVPSVRFDDQGVCNHCRMFGRLEAQYPLGEPARARFRALIDRMKAEGKGRKYDCVIGLSGGRDSTYCLYVAKQAGLRPLAVHFHNGWVSEPARENIDAIARLLDLEIKVVRPDWQEMRDYFRAALKASVPDFCMPCMIGIGSALYRAAAEENVRYIVIGTSFRQEGMTPSRWTYLDGRYFDDLVRRFGDRRLHSPHFNRMRIRDLLYFIGVKRIKTVQFPLYMDYRDAEIRGILEAEAGWKYGGKHHFDCIFKPLGSYIHDRKFGIDLRKIPLAALVRSGEVPRAEALASLREPPCDPHQPEIGLCLERLGLTRDELEAMLREPPRSFLDYRSYFSVMRHLGPVVKLMGKLNLVPETLYEKYFRLN